MHITSLHQETALPVTRNGNSRAQQATPWTVLGAGAADSHFPGHLPLIWTELREAWETWKKFSGKSFLINIYLTYYCIAISKLPLLGQAWDKPGLSKTFHWQEGSLLGRSLFPNEPDGAHLLVLGAVVWDCQISRCRKIPFSTGPHTLSGLLLSHTAGVGCRPASVSVRRLKFQQWWFKAQFSHSHVVPLSDPSTWSQGQETWQWDLRYLRASQGMTDADRDSPLTASQFRGSLGSSGCTNTQLCFSCPNISTNMESICCVNLMLI